MKRYLIVKLLLLIGLIAFFANCFVLPTDSTLPFRTVFRDTTKKTSVRNLVQKDNVEIKRILSIEPSDYEEIRFYKSNDIMLADEFLMVKFKSHDDWDPFRYAMEKHIEKIADIYQDYRPDESKKIKKYVVNIQGNYGYFYIGEDASQIATQFADALEE